MFKLLQNGAVFVSVHSMEVTLLVAANLKNLKQTV
jgi:hypothetical protein